MAVETKPDRSVEAENTAPVDVGYWTSMAFTALGIAYALVICVMIATGTFALPPPEWVQLFAALVTILSGPLLVVVLAALHLTVPAGRRLFSLLGVVFASAFMVMVSINRFVQLGVVRLSLLHGDTAGLERFLPYGTRSAMLTLEMVGWGFFLGLGLLSASFALPKEGLGRYLSWTFILYAVLGVTSTVAYVVESPLSVLGFVAWGALLPLAIALLAVWFGRQRAVAGRSSGSHR